jgi:hypothetical protein
MLLLIEWMKVADHLVQARGVQMGVDLGCFDAGMTQ